MPMKAAAASHNTSGIWLALRLRVYSGFQGLALHITSRKFQHLLLSDSSNRNLNPLPVNAEKIAYDPGYFLRDGLFPLGIHLLIIILVEDLVPGIIQVNLYLLHLRDLLNKIYVFFINVYSNFH